MKTIALCMIVRDESHVIRRCLDSCRPLVDYALVCDTGSTDETRNIVHNYLETDSIKGGGQVVDHLWHDFGYNRSLALSTLRDKWRGDYALVMDADDQLAFDPGFDPAAFKASLDADMYDVEVEHGPVRHWRPHLLSNHRGFRYRGVLHEFVEGPSGHSRGQTRGLRVLAGTEGARSRDPEKYKKDAWTLTEALKNETDPLLRSRYTFYAAQSWKDAGEAERAIVSYQARAEMGGWEGEVYISLWRAAQLMELSDRNPELILGTYLRAHEADPARAEALNSAVNWCHRTGRHHQGYLIGKHGVTLSEPEGKLFSEPGVYRWGILDNFSVAAYWSGHYQESYDAAVSALIHAPQEHRQRIKENVNFAAMKLGKEVLQRATAPVTPAGADFTIVVVNPPGYAHSGAYAELAETVVYGLRGLGYTVELRNDDAWEMMGGKIVVIGAHLMRDPPHEAIIYNTEHHVRIMGNERGMEEYRTKLIAAKVVWDYSAANVGVLTDRLGRNIKHVPLGYVPEMTRIEPAAEQDIDVLFYGALNERRQNVLDDLRAAGLRVEHLFGVYGAGRDAYIARAKVVLSMHYYLPGVFESLRVSYLLANRKAVVAELDLDGRERAELFHTYGVTLSKYENLVTSCRLLVGDEDARRQMEETGLECFKACRETDVLRAALRRRVWDCFLYNGEVDVLVIRLHELADVVDRFVIVEANTTFSGAPKGSLKLSTEFVWADIDPKTREKIHVVSVTDMPHLGDPWGRERHQRNAILRGLEGVDPSDLVMISDVDEIPRASVVQEMAEDLRHEFFALRLRFYYFLLNHCCTSGPEANRVWSCSVTGRLLESNTPDELRYRAQRGDLTSGATPHVLDDAGWHFSYLSDDDGVRAKIRAFSHQELNTPEQMKRVDVEGLVTRGEDLFGRPGYGWRLEPPDELPEWVARQPELMRRWTR